MFGIFETRHSYPPLRGRMRGVTLVELMVVVTIISILTAIMIPRLRIINKDRNIREAARIVGSVFANASQRAINEGGAGVLMERHPNFISTPPGIPGVRFACTTMYVMRNLPPYTGDDENSGADNPMGGNTITIDRPLEHDPTATPPRLVVQQNDYISLNHSSVRYRITNTPGPGSPMTLVLDNSGYLPDPPRGTDMPFVIHRQPRKLESSRVELPEGYFVDLRSSGPTVSGDDNIGSGCNQGPDLSDFTGDIVSANEIKVLFGPDGGIDQVYFFDNGPLSSTPPPTGGQIIGLRPAGSLYMFVVAYETDPSIDPINQASNLWVTVNNITGGTNIGYNAPPTGTLDMDGDGFVGTLGDRILESRGIAVNKQSALQ